MEDKEVGFITKPMIDEDTVLDDKQRLQTMAELPKLGQEAELAFLENRRAREEAEKVAGEEKGREGGEGEGSSNSPDNGKSTKEQSNEKEGTKGGKEDGGPQAFTKRKLQDREAATSTSSGQEAKRSNTGGGEEEDPASQEKQQGTVMEDATSEKGKSQNEQMDMSSSATAESAAAPAAASASSTPRRREDTSSGSSSSTHNRHKDGGGEPMEVSAGGSQEGGISGSEENMQQDTEEESEEDAEGEEWEDAEGEEQPETLAQWIRTVHKLRWERHIECEVRLAHHKHLRNLKQATTAGEDTISTNRFEWLKKEQEINEFYAAQYAWKARPDNNDLTVHNASYTKQFIWPKTYQSQGLKRSEQKRKAQQETAGKASNMEQGTDDSSEELEEREQIEEERRQAAILEAQINVLKDQNRELGGDTTNLQKIAYAPHPDINAAAKLFTRHNPGRRVILPYRWNSGNSNWEVAIHRSLALITARDSQCTRAGLWERITKDLPDKAQLWGSTTEDREEWEDKAGGKQTLDYRPIVFELQERAKLTEGLIWMPWQVVETIPYGLLGGSEAVEWVARGAEIITRSGVFTWLPDYIGEKLAHMVEEVDWAQRDP
ncbi:hypothetical protein CBR_g49452 [Chara braunii]|uniref:Uncharacterized protein n=1 Tax=Chara braunii TaxID=69332 RepID=A0A388K500_CHABU|nr:hypothetical protein CBR_g49452 [Chara braunii]|eukprot:GBG65089.1 hypothetical protein CBR_g49452 [Chara braunii]